MSAETPEQLRRRADVLESQQCTGLTARWCPVHGDCRCHRGSPVDHLDDPCCPLHAPTSAHAVAAALHGDEER